MSTRTVNRSLTAAAVVVLTVFPLLDGSAYYQNMLVLTFLLAIGATGWNIMGGYAGYISLGSSAFVGLGAYTTGILAARQGVTPWLGCLAGGLVCAVAAALLSLVTRRTRGMYFVIVTFAALQLLGVIATTWSSLTGGSQGLAMPVPTWSLAYEYWPFYYSLLALMLLAVTVSAWVRRSKLGLGLFAIRDDEDKVTGLGLPTNVYKLVAFVLGGTFLGVAGGIYAYDVTFLNTTAVFDIVTSMLIVLATLLGGRGTVMGPVLGAFIIEPLANFTTTNLGGADAGSIRLFLFGGLLGAVVLFAPRGILPSISAWRDRALGGAPQPAAAPATSSEEQPVGASLPQAATESGETVLQATGMTKAFGGLRAVDDVDLAVGSGAITGLIGPNGSGKTTLFNLIDGTVSSRVGALLMRGRRLERRSRVRRAHAGIARTYQLPRLFGSLTVLENVVLPERSLSIRRLFSPRVMTAERTRAHALLERMGLAAYADARPSDLSYGQRKLIELAQVLWLEPELLMLDEPAAGISPALTERLGEHIRALSARGVAILLVEHDLTFLSSLCQDVYVMSEGRIIAHGPIAEISADRGVIDAYLGDATALATPELAR
jgi:branched-chain amino acid transport system ATP-binding protein/branched-chain amino acid transport system permease protein